MLGVRRLKVLLPRFSSQICSLQRFVAISAAFLLRKDALVRLPLSKVFSSAASPAKVSAISLAYL